MLPTSGVLRWPFLLFLSLLLVIALCPAKAVFAQPAPVASSGVIDLQRWDFARDGPVTLAGEWQFFWQQFIDPLVPVPVPVPAQAAGSAQLAVLPGSWSGGLVMGSGLGSDGFASYRLRVACRQAEGLTLSLPLQHSAARVFVNGREIASQGSPGDSAASARPAVGQAYVALGGLACPLDIVAHVSNFSHRRAGLVRALQLGNTEQMQAQREWGLMRDMGALGGVGLMSVLPLLFFIWRPKERAPLYFGLFCLACCAFIATSGERVLLATLQPLGWDVYLSLMFLSFYGGLVMFAGFVHASYSKEFGRWPIRLVNWLGAAGVLLVVLTPARVYTQPIPALLVFALLLALYIVWVLARAAVRNRGKGSAPVLLAGFVVLAVAIIHDSIQFRHLMYSYWTPFGLLAFALAPGITLARRMSRALAAEELRSIEQRERTNLLVRATKAGLLDWDAISNTISYSERYKEILAYPPDAQTHELPGFYDLLHPDDSQAVRDNFKRELRDRSVQSATRHHKPMSYRMRRADGAYVWVHAEGIALLDASGQTLRFICSFIDISQAKQTEALMTEQVRQIQQAEQVLALERDRLQLLVRATKAGFGDWDAQRDVVSYSARYKEMLGYPADADTSAWPSIFELMHPDDRERAKNEFRKMIRRKTVSGETEPGKPMVYRLRRLDGSYIWIHAEGVSQVGEDGRTRRFITSYLDITSFREQEEALRVSHDQISAQAAQLERQNEALMENVRLREEVERIARHDIKTPLNSIIAVPRLLREERRLSTEADELLGIVERAGYRILSMVNLSLDLYKMEQGSYIFRPDAVDIVDLLDKIAVDMRSHAASKHVSLKLDRGANQLFAWAEELLCYSLLANLLKNAVEASPEGEAVTTRLQAAEPGHLMLHIHNQGVVPAAVRASFFTKYATAGKASGTGLGTYSARLMARTQDGEVTMQTSELTGTTLSVRLRAAPPGKMPPTARHAGDSSVRQPQSLLAGLPALQVLLVDDDEYHLLIVRRILPSPPLRVATAFNGRVALDMALAQPPDVVFMDMDMPVMGGLEAIALLRRQEAAMGRPASFAVALSSHDDEETRARCLAGGFDRYLSKPVTRELLQQTLLDYLEGAKPTAVPLSADAAAGPAPAPGALAPVVIDPDIADLLDGFLASRQELLLGMDAAVAMADRESLRRLAHQMAGGLAIYGFEWAAGVCKSIELQAPAIEFSAVKAMMAELSVHLQTANIVVDNSTASDAPDEH